MDNILPIVFIIVIIVGFVKVKGNDRDSSPDWNKDDYLPDDDNRDSEIPDDEIPDDDRESYNLLSYNEVMMLSTTEVLARTLYGEARGENNAELYRIGEVITNRVNDYKFPQTIKEVCLQKAQFSCWNSLYYDVLKNNHKVVRQENIDTPRYSTIKNIARDIITNSYEKTLPYQTLYYFIPENTDVIEDDIIVSSNDDWKVGLKVVYKGNKHYFFREWL